MTNISPEVVFGMSFLILSGADVYFLDWELWWRIYTIKKALLTTRRIELVEKKEFAAIALDPEHVSFVVYIVSFGSVASLSSTPIDTIYPFRRP